MVNLTDLALSGCLVLSVGMVLGIVLAIIGLGVLVG